MSASCLQHRRGRLPTTHILKLPLGLVGGSRRMDLSDSVENEWLCGRIVSELGLPVAEAEIVRFEDQKALAVTRFDRQWMDKGKWIARIPQEDFCQALGHPPSHRYEKEGGPGMAAALQLLEGSSEGSDRGYFALAQLVFWLLGATDGHAKNFSLFLTASGGYAMTPLYDVMSVFPHIGDGANQIRWKRARLAMALRSDNVHYALQSIQARHWHALAQKVGAGRLWQHMCFIVEQAGPALERVAAGLPSGFPERTFLAISKGIKEQAARFKAGLADLG